MSRFAWILPGLGLYLQGRRVLGLLLGLGALTVLGAGIAADRGLLASLSQLRGRVPKAAWEPTREARRENRRRTAEALFVLVVAGGLAGRLLGSPDR